MDNQYYNQTSQNINENVEVVLERTETPLPFHSQKPQRKELVEEKKEVVGFNQINFQKVVEKGDKICATCLGSLFPDIKEYKEHIKSDWHKENLKRKMKGEPPITREELLNGKLLETML